MVQQIKTDEWYKPVNGKIDMPDRLGPLIQSIGGQLKYHAVSGTEEIETACKIAFLAEKFFNTEQQKAIAERLNKISIKEIVQIVSDITDVPVKIMMCPSRKRAVVNARDLCHYIVRKRTMLTGQSMTDYLNQDHAIGIYASRKIKGFLDIKDRVTCSFVSKIEDKLNNG